MKPSLILFDLDGSLLPMDQDAFVKVYFSALAKKICPYASISQSTRERKNNHHSAIFHSPLSILYFIYTKSPTVRKKLQLQQPAFVRRSPPYFLPLPLTQAQFS